MLLGLMGNRHKRKPGSLGGRLTALLRLGGLLGITCYSIYLIRGRLQLSGSESALTHPGPRVCPPAIVDWDAFTDPGPMFTGPAAIYTSDFSDMSLLWIIHSLQGLGYSVSLYADPDHQTDASHFLVQAATLGIANARAVPVHKVTVDERGELQGDNVSLFVYMCPDELPTLSGLGTANILIMRHELQPPHGAAAASKPPGTDVQLRALASYDFLLYLSQGAYVQRLPRIMPLLERMQREDQLFPLVDMMSIPAAPVSTPTAELGVTLSMSRYDRERRRLLTHALQEFKLLQNNNVHGIQLILCSWLIPGISSDLPFLLQKIRSLDLSSVFEYRDDTDQKPSYQSIAVQWHLYNPEEKPHATATMSMPAGVWVMDCTGTLSAAPSLLYGDCASLNELHTSTLRFLRQPDSTRSSRGRQVVQKSLEAVTAAYKFKWLYLGHRSFSSKIIRYFMKTTQAAYRARINPAWQKQHAKLHARSPPTERNAAVIVEARPHYGFLYVVLNAALYLPGWRIHVVHSRMNAAFVRRVLEPHVSVTYHQLDAENVDIDDYNMLMKNSTFWQWFGADHVLLFQTDSLILKYGVEQFTKFDYVGAPWHQENERWSQPALRNALPEGVGNGGFSMRSIKAMVDITKTYGARSPIKEQEDVFFAVHIQNHPSYMLADRKTAYRFCLEVPCMDLPPADPLALHAAWFYTPVYNMQRLLETSLNQLPDCDGQDEEDAAQRQQQDQ